ASAFSRMTKSSMPACLSRIAIPKPPKPPPMVAIRTGFSTLGDTKNLFYLKAIIRDILSLAGHGSLFGASAMAACLCRRRRLALGRAALRCIGDQAKLLISLAQPLCQLGGELGSQGVDRQLRVGAHAGGKERAVMDRQVLQLVMA